MRIVSVLLAKQEPNMFYFNVWYDNDTYKRIAVSRLEAEHSRAAIQELGLKSQVLERARFLARLEGRRGL